MIKLKYNITKQNKYIFYTNYIFNKTFTNSAILFSDKFKIDLKKEDIKLSEEEILNLKKGVDELKHLVTTNSEVEEVKSLLDKYVKENPSYMSSYDEAFPKLISNSSEDLKNISEKENNITFNIVKSIYENLEKCSKNGTIDENCVKNANLSEIINKVISNSVQNSQELESDKIKTIGQIVNDTLEKEGIIKKIGEITLKDIYDKMKNLDNLLQIKLTPNYINYGLNLVSYGILLRGYNKFVHNQPIPSNISAEELRVIKTTRTVTRFWFAGLVAPMIVLSLNKLRENRELLKIEINPLNDNDNKNISLNNSLFLLFLKNLKNNSASFNLIWIFSIITVLFILLIIILWYLDIFNILNFISELQKNIIMDYLKNVTMIIIIIPIIINSIMLYLLTRNNNFYTKILEQDKFSAAFWVNFINSLINIINKNELKNYYILTCRAELIIYLFILIIYYIFIY